MLQIDTYITSAQKWSNITSQLSSDLNYFWPVMNVPSLVSRLRPLTPNLPTQVGEFFSKHDQRGLKELGLDQAAINKAFGLLTSGK